MTYSEKLKDPRWQKKRLEMLEAAGWECEWCGDDTKTLAVHHTIYHKNREPWEYEDYEYRVFCEGCHEEDHRMRGVIRDFMSDPNHGGVHALYSFVKGVQDSGLPSNFWIRDATITEWLSGFMGVGRAREDYFIENHKEIERIHDLGNNATPEEQLWLRGALR